LARPGRPGVQPAPRKRAHSNNIFRNWQGPAEGFAASSADMVTSLQCDLPYLVNSLNRAIRHAIDISVIP
jgi:hypothetical protein